MPKLREPNPEALVFTDTWPQFLREARIEANLSQWAMSRRAAVSPGRISDWETGRRQVPVWAQVVLCDRLGYPVAAVFPRDGREMVLANLHRKRREESPAFAERLADEQARHHWVDVRLGKAS